MVYFCQFTSPHLTSPQHCILYRTVLYVSVLYCIVLYKQNSRNSKVLGKAHTVLPVIQNSDICNFTKLHNT